MPRHKHRTPSTPLEAFPSLLEALKLHLLPSPILSSLPSALQIFAHFQILSQKIISQAQGCLDRQKFLIEEIKIEGGGSGVDHVGLIARGCLTVVEGERVNGLKKRDEEDTMLGLMLALQKDHIAKALSTPGINPKKIVRLIDTYFPNLMDTSGGTTVDHKNHDMLYIRALREEDIPILGVYRKDVLGWYRLAISNYEKQRGPPTLKSMIGKAPPDRMDKLAGKIVREAEKCWQDAQDFVEIFASPRELEIKIEEQVHAPVLATDVVSRTMSRRSMENRWESIQLAEEVFRRSGSSKMGLVSVRRQTLPAESISQNRNDHHLSIRPRISLPQQEIQAQRTHRTITREQQSRSPSPEHMSSLPRLNLDSRKGRYSIIRNSTPAPMAGPSRNPEPLFMDIDDDDDNGNDVQNSPPSEPAIQQPKITPIARSRSIIPSSGLIPSPNLPSFTISTSTTQAQQNLIRKKKKRLSSGLPPPEGPNYTAPRPSHHLSPEQLKPFSTTELYRGERRLTTSDDQQLRNDENHPKRQKIAPLPQSVSTGREGGREREVLGNGDSQENSQDSVESSQTRLKRRIEKGKGRAEPRGPMPLIS